jgi:hypothetical protein
LAFFGVTVYDDDGVAFREEIAGQEIHDAASPYNN